MLMEKKIADVDVKTRLTGLNGCEELLKGSQESDKESSHK